jgi:hypothetical protein
LLFLTEFLLKYVDPFNGILKTINMSHRMSKISFLNLDILKVDREVDIKKLEVTVIAFLFSETC